MLSDWSFGTSVLLAHSCRQFTSARAGLLGPIYAKEPFKSFIATLFTVQSSLRSRVERLEC
jgi:hypothetical protein